MVLGSIKGDIAKEASTLPLVLKAAVSYLKATDFTKLKEGNIDTTLAGVKVVVQIHDLTTSPRATTRPEIHHKFVDVQLLASGGPEYIGVYHDDGTSVVDEDLLASERDILYYKAGEHKGESTIIMNEGNYAIFYPWDVHSPGCIAGDKPAKIRKIVIKVPLEACV